MPHTRYLTLAVLLLGLTSANAQSPVDYLKQIKPILKERCFACHGVLKQKGGLRLDSLAFLNKGGNDGPAVNVKNHLESPLLQRVSSKKDSERMPPEGEHLTAEQIKLIGDWIAQGAKGPLEDPPETDPRDHWAFKTPVRPAIPAVVDPLWNKNPIDAFLAAKLQASGLKHQPPGDKRRWLRRVYIDLIGLPPTLDQQEAFIKDTSSDAMTKVVDQLLASPQYGERWGRHWMDIWRYSDWWGLGAEVRNSQKHIWRWRDWIIESLNADKGYDQMLREMLAADELYPNDLDRLRASGFLARQYFKFNRTSWLDETIEHTSKAMLGMTFNCSKCHDHKYDPISQTEYYRLRAIFEPYQVRTDLLPGVTDVEQDGVPRAFDCNLNEKTFLHVRGDDRNPDKNKSIEPAVPAFLSQAAFKISSVKLPPEAVQPALRAFVVEAYLKDAESKIALARKNLEAAQQKLASLPNDPAPKKIAPPQPKEATGPVIKDNFAKARPDLWKEPTTGKWEYKNNKLTQLLTGDERAALVLKEQPAENFEATLKFRTLGGAMWKSVGIGFDVAAPREALAYASAYAGGPKTQVSFNNGSGYQYPAEGAQNRKIDLNTAYDLTLRVRGQLVNLLINNELSVSYYLPEPRRKGDLQLITYDANAEFLEFSLKPLANDIAMAPAKNTPKQEVTSPKKAAQIAVDHAEKALRFAEAQPALIRAKAEAEAAKYLTPNTGEAKSLAKEAHRLEMQSAVLKAEWDLAVAPDAKKPEVEKTVHAARKTASIPGESYTPLLGSLKTFENNLETEDSRRKPFPDTSTGRRTALANWMTDPKNPLPARVAVNHIWARHFGKPLVPTVFDFGRKGTPPTHPELLDWLAVELVEHNWSMKHLHRLMVLSEAYRMTSSAAGADSSTVAKDPDNKLYWRGNPIRMEAQVVRDGLLQLAGELDFTMGGPPVPSGDEKSRRRSLYFFHSHNDHQQFLSIFDDANVLECYRRADSIVPQQALALENSQLAGSMAEKIAKRLPAGIEKQFVRAAFMAVIGSEPTAAEQDTALEGIKNLAESAKKNKRPDPEIRARIGLVHALINHNDFVTVR